MPDMPGGFVRSHNWTNEALQGLTISQVEFDQDGSEVAAALNNRLRLDGQASALSADVNLGGQFTLTGARDGTAPGDLATTRQVQAVSASSAFVFCLAVFGL